MHIQMTAVHKIVCSGKIPGKNTSIGKLIASSAPPPSTPKVSEGGYIHTKKVESTKFTCQMTVQTSSQERYDQHCVNQS